jgi:beta-N-acetylhexosaminidase
MMLQIHKVLLLTILLCAFNVIGVNAQLTSSPTTTDLVDVMNKPSSWADSVMKKMSKKEKIAQLFIVPIYSNKPIVSQDSMLAQISKYRPGGIQIFNGSPQANAYLQNYAQTLLRIPAFVAIDGEWGMSQRIDSIVSYPYEMTLGAIQDNELIYKLGLTMAAQLKRAGVNINFAPVLDVSNSSNSSSFRSYGEDRDNVAEKGVRFIKGLQDGGIIAVAKYFPSMVYPDSVLTTLTRKRVDSVELYPFNEAIKNDVIGIMVGHSYLPVLDTMLKRPASISDTVVKSLLREKMQFNGLIFTDAMRDNQIMSKYTDAESAVMAFNAGNDMIRLAYSLPDAIAGIEKAVKKKKIDKHELNRRVRRVITARYAYGLDNYKPIYINDLSNDLNSAEINNLNERLYDAATTTLIKPNGKIIKDGDSVAVVSVGSTNSMTLFQEIISTSTPSSTFSISHNPTPAEVSLLKAKLKTFNKVVIGIHDYRNYPRNTLNYNNNLMYLIGELIDEKESYVCVMANPYTIATIPSIENSNGLWVLYQDSRYSESSAAKVILNQLDPQGLLPVNINEIFKIGMKYE